MLAQTLLIGIVYNKQNLGAKSCGKFDCVFVDKCNGNSNLNYVCLPFDMQFFM